MVRVLSLEWDVRLQMNMEYQGSDGWKGEGNTIINNMVLKRGCMLVLRDVKTNSLVYCTAGDDCSSVASGTVTRAVGARWAHGPRVPAKQLLTSVPKNIELVVAYPQYFTDL